jgi:hypothetical protein
VNPFESIIGGQTGQANEPNNSSAMGSGTEGPKTNGTDRSNEQRPDTLSPDNVIFLNPAPSPTAKYLDQSVDLESLRIPFARFPGIRRVVPEREAECPGWSDFVQEIAPDPAPVFDRKDKVPYYIAGTLKEAELKNPKLRERRLKKGQGTVGKQRSGAHIDTLGPALLMDDDGDVFEREATLRALGAAVVIYSSYSFGFSKGVETEPARGGRVALALSRSVTTAEYPFVWDAVNHLLGGGLDEHGRSSALCYGQHARRNDQAPYRRLVIEGAALNADALVELGRSLRPGRSEAAPSQTRRAERKRTRIEEIERARLMGTVFPPDDYNHWMSGAAAYKRALPNDPEAAFLCFDAWSACSSKYQGTQAARAKFDDVAADYEGTAAPVTLEMLHWRARRRAEAILRALYSPSAHWQKASAFEGLDPESVGAGVILPKGAEPIPPGTLKPGDGIAAIEYLRYCWSEKVYRAIFAEHAIPQSVLEEAQRLTDQRRENLDLAGRRPHIWDGNDLAKDTAALADAIVAADPQLYRIDNVLVRISEPAADPATAARVRKLHSYQGQPGGDGDPALHAGERLVPILQSDAEALREIIAENVARKRSVNHGTDKNPDCRDEITSFEFKPSAKLNDQPDAGVLKDLGKRALVARVPEILGVITAPVMPDLPSSTDPADLLKAGAGRLITRPGFDSPSGLFLSPIGTIVDVPEAPSEADVKAAADLLQEPWSDFPFVSPGEEIGPDVSRSAAVYTMMLAANRRGLEIASGTAFTSHGEGMSNGKTLAGEIICTMATGKIPTPVTLSPDFTEQRKEIITHLVEGDGCLFLDNIPNGARFDSAPLAAAMTNPRYKSRLLGTTKSIEASTRTMVVATGNAINLAGDLASRFLSARLDTGLERPEDRSVTDYKIPDLRRWVLENRQRLVAAVHTIVQGYLRACRSSGGTPDDIAPRRAAGTRFGGPCEFLRDAFLWAFPCLPDPFLSFKASAANSSTKEESALVLAVLDRLMSTEAGRRFVPAWFATTFMATKPQQRLRWEKSFRARWNRMARTERERRYQTPDLNEAERLAWERIRRLVQLRSGRRELRAGRIRFTSSQIVSLLQSALPDFAIVDGATHGKGGNPVALGRWLKQRLVGARFNGLVLCSAQRRDNSAEFWVTNGG